MDYEHYGEDLCQLFGEIYRLVVSSIYDRFIHLFRLLSFLLVDIRTIKM